MIFMSKSEYNSVVSAAKGNQSDSTETMGSRKRKIPEALDMQSPDEKSTADDGSSSSPPQEPMVPPYQIYREKVDISRVPRTFYPIEGVDDNEDSDERNGFYAFPENDIELLEEWWTPSTWRGSKSKQPEVYHVDLKADSCTVEDCLKLLKGIGCEDRFISCSVEKPHLFFAELNKEEADKLKALDGIFGVCPDSDIMVEL